MPRACDGCSDPNPIGLLRVTFQRSELGPTYSATWCEECRDLADLAIRGATSYGAYGLEPIHAITAHTLEGDTTLCQT